MTSSTSRLLSTASPAEARKVIDRIAEKNGFVSEEDLATIPSATRGIVRRALLAKDRKIAASVLTLARNLYTSNARFVFELLQNSDDNLYSTGQVPSVSFSLYHNRLVVDCNEDGFTEDDLRAICDIGNSSKSNSQGYIGEKGIGFKSVFMAAYKVHIQSGNLSFSFVHRKGDSGMGMVMPMWEETATPLASNRTRITLFLHEDADAEREKRDREDIRQQFRELEPAVLLFVRKLRRVDVTFYNEHDFQVWTTRLTRRPAGESNRVIVDRRVSGADCLDEVEPESHIYHVTEYTATNVARHEGRDSGSEEASPSPHETQIVLAFPITAESVPVIEQQKVFAFLPIKKMGFNFLIQADFVTQANREDVVTTSARNRDLRRCVTDAVVKAIRQFCEHKTLQHTWMRYLPRQGTHHWDPFWNSLVKGIAERLKHENVVRTRGRGVLRRISDMRDRPRSTNDRHGHPLFPDLEPEMYLADSYARGDINTLKAFGLGTLYMNEVIETVRRDLTESGAPSRLRSSETDESWHSLASWLLMLPFEKNWSDHEAEVRQLAIIPLEDGSWASAEDGDIYYGNIGDVVIPRDLGLKVIAQKAAENERRVELFNALGVQTADIAMVRNRILALHRENNGQDISFHRSLVHLRFLYLTHESRPEDEDSPRLVVYDHLNRPRCALEHDLYMEDDHPYGAQSLLGTAAMSSFGASFVDLGHFEETPSIPPGTRLTWAEWMHEYVGVRRSIRLLSRDGTSLSGECRYIAEHQGHKFLEFLRRVWPTEGGAATRCSRVLGNLRCNLLVTCTNGDSVYLDESYMPSDELRSAQSRFADTDVIHFLDIPSYNDASLRSQWSFLTDDLAVNFRDNLNFRLDLLFQLFSQKANRLTAQEASRLFNLYQYIEAWCIGSDDPVSDRDSVYEDLQEWSSILVPSCEDGLETFKWVMTEDCLWDAPGNFTTKYPLKAVYSRFGIDVDGGNSLRHFFQGTLRIPDISHEHIVDELSDMRGKSRDANTVANLYRLLQGLYEADPNIADGIRDSFEASSLVYAERRGSWGWYSPSQCLWSSTTSIEGKVAINDQYAEFEKLFMRVLGVPHLTLAMVHVSLMDAASSGATTEQVKQLLLEFNALLQKETNPPSSGRLCQRRVFPVKSPGNNNATLCSRETEFFIVDRDDLFAAFGDRVKCLDFSLSDVCLLRRFITWAGLEPRYLSRCVDEVSRVQGGVEWPLRDPKRDVRNKAYGLLRIAAKFQSPRYHADPQALYDLLRTAKMVEAEGISSRWAIHQDGQVYEHEVSTSYLHIEEREEMLKVYVPRDKGEWDNCFLDALPRRVLTWMMTPPGSAEVSSNSADDAAVNVVTVILNCDVSTTPSLLKVKSVPEITEVDEEPLPTLEPQGTSPPATPTRRRHAPGLLPESPDAPSEAVTPEPFSSPDNGDARYVTPLTDPGDYESDGSGAVPWPSDELSVARQGALREEYKRLLESAVVMAERMARGDYSTDISGAFDGLSLDDDDVFTGTFSRHHLTNDGDRHRKIGAAGELFVYVLLSNLDPVLPSFGVDSWRSTIRHLAAAHPRYRDLTRWTGRETSDIVYDDASGALTALLIRKGHLSGSQWEGRTPKYYIEVKATLDRCGTPFYVSPSQAERMLRSTNGPSGGDNQHEVYVIFRVFNLGAESTGLAIYVDPQEQRRTGKLEFTTTEKYTVVPGYGF